METYFNATIPVHGTLPTQKIKDNGHEELAFSYKGQQGLYLHV